MIRKLSLILLAALPAICPLSALAAEPLSANLKGRILLQVEAKGEAWYIDPVTEKRAYLGRPADAFAVMRSYGLGISNKDLAKIGTAKESNKDMALAKKLAGRILLQIEAKGEAWYINPLDLKKYYLGRPNDAFALMRAKGLGISNANLEKIISTAPVAPIKPIEIITPPTENQTPSENKPATSTEIIASSSQATTSAGEIISPENLAWKSSVKIATNRNTPQTYYSGNGDLWIFYTDNYNNLYSKMRKNGEASFDQETLISGGAKKASPWFNSNGEIKKLAVSANSQVIIMETNNGGVSWSTIKSYSNQDQLCSPAYPEAKITGDNGELLVFGYKANSGVFGCYTSIRSANFKNNIWGDEIKIIGNGDLILASSKESVITIVGSASVFRSLSGGASYAELKGGDTTDSRLGAQSAFNINDNIFLGRSYSYGPEGQANRHLGLVLGKSDFSLPERVIIQSSDSYYKGFEVTGSGNIFMAIWTMTGSAGRLKGSISYDSGKTWSQAFDIARTATGYDIPFLDTGENTGFKASSLHGQTAIAYTAQKGNSNDIYLVEYK